jgi:hypothetical protein
MARGREGGTYTHGERSVNEWVGATPHFGSSRKARLAKTGMPRGRGRTVTFGPGAPRRRDGRFFGTNGEFHESRGLLRPADHKKKVKPKYTLLDNRSATAVGQCVWDSAFRCHLQCPKLDPRQCPPPGVFPFGLRPQFAPEAKISSPPCSQALDRALCAHPPATSGTRVMPMYHQDLADLLDRYAVPVCSVLAAALGVIVPFLLASAQH